MVLEYPFVWPLWNAAENSQRQVCKQSLTLSESTTCDGLCLASHLFPRKRGALGLVQEFISGEALDEYARLYTTGAIISGSAIRRKLQKSYISRLSA